MRLLFLTILAAYSMCISFAYSTETGGTIGHKIITLFSELPNQPDVSTELDRLIKVTVDAIAVNKTLEIANERSRALATFEVIADTLRSNGYYHHYGTYPDSLITVLSSSTHRFDCDTGSYIYLSVAEQLGLPVFMVEIEVPGEPSRRGFGDHNFVRWATSDGSSVDWDPNGEYSRQGDLKTNLYGYAWSEDQLLGYVYFTRGIAWRKHKQFSQAISDYETSIHLFPEYPKARNNLAWLLSTVAEVQQLGRADDALNLATQSVQLQPSPNNRDTLACAYAINGDLETAIEIQSLVIKDEPADVFKRRLALFQNGQNCLGED